MKVSIVKNPHTPDRARIAEMTREALDLIGGLGSIVKQGDFVIVKSNFFAPYPPPVTVDRRLVRALLQQCFDAGASRVVLCEGVSIGTKLGRKTITSEIVEELGIMDEVRAVGAEMVCLEDVERIDVKVPNAKSIGVISYPKLLLECDVLIDLPCMKMHGFTLVTLGIKNFQGLFTDVQKYYAHRDDLEQKLVDVFKIRKPDLTLIDAITAMEGNGAGEHGTPHPMNMLIASRDVVAADAVASACMGIADPLDVTATRIANHEGIGIGELDKIEVVGAKIADVVEKFVFPTKFQKEIDRNLLGVYKNVDVYIGGACRMCWNMGINIAKTLSKYPDRHFNLVIGHDPKFPGADEAETDETIFIGDCACATTGMLKDLRNRMLIEGKGLLACGCPPYRPASTMLEKYLKEHDLLDQESIQKSQEAIKKKNFDYYKRVDPTWMPKSQRLD